MTLAEKLVADYAGVSLFEVYEMQYFDYCLLLHDAAIMKWEATKEGREHLHACYVDFCEDADTAELKKLFKNGGRLGGG